MPFHVFPPFFFISYDLTTEMYLSIRLLSEVPRSPSQEMRTITCLADTEPVRFGEKKKGGRERKGTTSRNAESFNSGTPRKRGIAPRAIVGRQLPSDLPREAL